MRLGVRFSPFIKLISYTIDIDIECSCNAQIYNGPQLKATAMRLSRGNLRTTKSNYSPHYCNSKVILLEMSMISTPR